MCVDLSGFFSFSFAFFFLAVSSLCSSLSRLFLSLSVFLSLSIYLSSSLLARTVSLTASACKVDAATLVVDKLCGRERCAGECNPSPTRTTEHHTYTAFNLPYTPRRLW